MTVALEDRTGHAVAAAAYLLRAPGWQRPTAESPLTWGGADGK